MKDKRQRIAMAWPYALAYTDPTMAATFFAAATAALPHTPYVGTSNLPATAHLTPSATPYPSAAAAAAYYTRYAPYAPTAANAVVALHRPHPRTVPYSTLPPHLLQSQPSLTPLHFNLGVPSINSAAYSPVVRPPPTTNSYRHAMLPQFSPANSANSDGSASDCEYVGGQQAAHRISHPHQDSRIIVPPVTSISTPQQQVNNIMPAAPISNFLESRATVYSVPTNSTTTSSISSTKIEQPKLFQPYKTDIPEETCAK
jgi:homeobox even-skipped family protein